MTGKNMKHILNFHEVLFSMSEMAVHAGHGPTWMVQHLSSATQVVTGHYYSKYTNVSLKNSLNVSTNSSDVADSKGIFMLKCSI